MSADSLKRVSPSLPPFAYQAKIAGEKVIKSSPSTGINNLYNCNFFYLRGSTKEERDKPDGKRHKGIDVEEPWVVLKSIPNARIVNKQLILTENNKPVYGLQYHYLTQSSFVIKNKKIVFTEEDKKKFEEEYEFDFLIRLNSNLVYPVAKDSESFEEVFFLGETDNFGHWLFEFLPKLLWYKKYLFDANINVPILVGEAVPDRWLEVGNPLGIPAENFQRVKLGKTLKIKKLYICGPSVCRDFENKKHFARIEDISELRVIFRKYYKLDLIPKTVDILFETRERSRWRKIVNEDNLISRVKKEVGLNTEKFFPEEMTFKEQIEKLQSSKVFVGTGASLPFSFFMCKDSVLVEVRNPTGSGFATHITSDIFRIPYYRPTTQMGEQNTGPTHMDTDLLIDENEFVKSMNILNKVFLPFIV